jgi:acyl-CoA thioester hydrolase
MFKTSRRVQFYETDLMGIVHHSNYLRFYEEARVQWAVERGVLAYAARESASSASSLAVLETQVKHLKPLKFGDLIEIELQVRGQGVRLEFAYKMRCPERDHELVSTAKTVHVSLGENLRPRKMSEQLKHILEKETWIETWLLSSSE